jgi:hypothetical protein
MMIIGKWVVETKRQNHKNIIIIIVVWVLIFPVGEKLSNFYISDQEECVGSINVCGVEQIIAVAAIIAL